MWLNEKDNASYRGQVFIVAAPSGGGKTSLVKTLCERLEDIEVSVSHTTRLPRPREVNGQDYYFVNESQFVEMIHQNAFFEHAQVFNHYYGTSIAEIERRLAAGIDVVLDIDWQGAEQVRQLYDEVVTIFVFPPSLEVLKERLRGRAQDNEIIIQQRMAQAQDEMQHYAEFDYLIVNDDFEKAAAALQAIVVASRLTLANQVRKLGKWLSLLAPSQ